MSTEVASTYTSPALDELEKRAGPPDTDRPAWMAFRNTGVTATQARDLYLGRITAQQLAKQKHEGGDEDLSHIPVIAWGREREPQIAASLRRYGVEPEHRVFFARENRRHLASPDGVGADFDDCLLVSEIKTGAAHFIGWDAMVAKGYLAQMVWVMYVIGATKCRYEFEVREEGERGGFEPGERYGEWIALDDHRGLLAKLIALVNAALVVIDAYEPSEVADIDEAIDTAAVNYLRFKAEAESAKAAQDAAYATVRGLCGSSVFRQESMVALVSKSADSVRTEEVRVVDEEHRDVVLARAVVRGAQEALAQVEEKHSRVETREVVTKGRLTIKPRSGEVKG